MDCNVSGTETNPVTKYKQPYDVAMERERYESWLRLRCSAAMLLNSL